MKGKKRLLAGIVSAILLMAIPLTALADDTPQVEGLYYMLGGEKVAFADMGEYLNGVGEDDGSGGIVYTTEAGRPVWTGFNSKGIFEYWEDTNSDGTDELLVRINADDIRKLAQDMFIINHNIQEAKETIQTAEEHMDLYEEYVYGIAGDYKKQILYGGSYNGNSYVGLNNMGIYIEGTDPSEANAVVPYVRNAYVREEVDASGATAIADPFIGSDGKIAKQSIASDRSYYNPSNSESFTEQVANNLDMGLLLEAISNPNVGSQSVSGIVPYREDMNVPYGKTYFEVSSGVQATDIYAKDGDGNFVLDTEGNPKLSASIISAGGAQSLKAATADNLSYGTAAWVNGEYIVGTGADNNRYYIQGTTQAQNPVLVGNISISYHVHQKPGETTDTTRVATPTSTGYAGVPSQGDAWANYTAAKERAISDNSATSMPTQGGCYNTPYIYSRQYHSSYTTGCDGKMYVYEVWNGHGSLGSEGELWSAATRCNKCGYTSGYNSHNGTSRPSVGDYASPCPRKTTHPAYYTYYEGETVPSGYTETSRKYILGCGHNQGEITNIIIVP